ncbi:MAG: chemotaxis protein CheD [Bryobacteraceae bacterium]
MKTAWTLHLRFYETARGARTLVEESRMTTVVVNTADCKVSGDPDVTLVTYGLGSCIAVVVHDPATKVSGMLHFMLPDSSIDRARAEANPYMFADTGIPRLIDAVCERGANKRHLSIWAVGGAQVLDRENCFQIGKRNHLAVRKILWKGGLFVGSEDVGGTLSRTVRLEAASGRLVIYSDGVQRELPAGRMSGGATCLTAF